MLGLIRFSLALAVLFSHVPGFDWALNPGVVAVICFYCISGYLMRCSYQRFTRFAQTPVRDFIVDRVLKLFPQYLVVLAITAGLLWLWGASPGFWLMNQQLSPLKLLWNLLLLPANYVFEPLVISELLPHPLVPPAWSLATEFHFYLLLPLLYRWRILFMVMLLATLAVQIFGFVHESTRFNSDNLGYRYIFGVLPVFLMGYLYADDSGGRRPLAVLLWLLYLGLACCAFTDTLIHQQRAREVLLGASVALPLLATTMHVRGHAWLGRIRALDERLGNLAYPIFITHCLGFFIIEHVTGMPVRASASFVLCAIILCLLLSMPLELMQRRLERARIALRGFASMKTDQRLDSDTPARINPAPSA